MMAASVTLVWDPSPEAVSYRLYVSIQHINGDPAITWYPTSDTQYQVDGLDYGTEYFFRATSFNADGIESAYSNEVQLTVPTPTPLPMPTPEPIPIPTPAPTPTPDHPGNATGWWRNLFNQ